MILELPLQIGQSSYEFTADLEGVTYNFKMFYVERSELWHFNLSTITGEKIASGIPIATNTDLLRQIVSDLKPKGAFFAIDETGNNKDARKQDLGTTVKFLYIESNEQ